MEGVEEEVKRSRLKAKLNELWALLGAILASREGAKAVSGSGEWAVVDEDGVAQIAQVRDSNPTYACLNTRLKTSHTDPGRAANGSRTPDKDSTKDVG